MRINFNRFLAFILLLASLSLFSTSLEEAERNLDLGYFVISEYLFNDLLETGNQSERVLTGLSASLINQAKYDELITLSQRYKKKNIIFNRNVAYAYFINYNYQSSYYYYNKALKQDKLSELDLSGRGWSAYYLGKYSLAYEDLTKAESMSEHSNELSGINYLEKYWKSNNCSIFTLISKDMLNLNLNYGWYLPSFNIQANFNHNKANDSKRDIINLQTAIYKGNFSYEFSSFSAKGDYSKLYDAWGLAFRTKYLMMFKDFNSYLSLTGGYSYYEVLSSQQLRTDVTINRGKLSLSSGISYLYLDYITPDYDKQNIIGHASLFYRIIPSITLNYHIDLGESNFSYNDYLLPYDDNDDSNLLHTFGVSTQVKSLTIYLSYLLKSHQDNRIGSGVSYVF